MRERVRYTKGEIQPRLLFSNQKYSSLPLSLSTITLSCSQSLESHVLSVIMWAWSEWRYLNFIALAVVCFTFNTSGPGLLGPLSIISTRVSGRAAPASPPPPPPSAPGFLSVVINGTRAPARLTLPVPAMFPWYLMNSDKLLFPSLCCSLSPPPPPHPCLFKMHGTELPLQHLGVSSGPLWISQEADV